MTDAIKFDIKASEIQEVAQVCSMQLSMNMQMQTQGADFNAGKYCMVQMAAWATLLLLNSANRAGTTEQYTNMLAGMVPRTVAEIDKQIAEAQLRAGATKQ